MNLPENGTPAKSVEHNPKATENKDNRSTMIMGVIAVVGGGGLLIVCCGFCAIIGFLMPDDPESEGSKGTQASSVEKPPKISEVVVAGAEPDENKWRAAESWGTSHRVAALKKVHKKFKQMPNRFTRVKDEEQYIKELRQLVKEFREIPFNGSYQSIDARTMIDYWEKHMADKYAGRQYELLELEMVNIYVQYKHRVH